MNAETQDAKAPTSFWVVALLGLLWNAFGAYLYMLAKLDPETALAQASPALREYVAAMPLWAHVGWSLGVWGSLAGSLLMLARSRHAVTAFLLSLLGAVLSYAAQAMADVLTPAEPAVIMGVIVFLWWFCRNETVKGTLR
jgi:hypothetical protein